MRMSSWDPQSRQSTVSLRPSTVSESHRSELNRRPLDYESRALPLSYGGRMPWVGFEPTRLAPPPPQDGVSTSFTTRAFRAVKSRWESGRAPRHDGGLCDLVPIEHGSPSPDRNRALV